MSEWIPLKSFRLNRPATMEMKGGVEVSVYLSPHDIPDAVRGNFDKQTGMFHIDFRYLTDEVPESLKEQEHVVLRVGKHSKRVLGVDVNIRALQAHEVTLKLQVPELVHDQMERLAQRPIVKNRIGNYQTVSKVLEERKSQVFSELAAA